MRACLVVVLLVVLTGCWHPTATVLGPGVGAFPAASENLLDPANCPDGDGEGGGLLHDPVDGTVSAVMAARREDGFMYALCRESYHGLIEHERERLQWVREKRMEEE